MDLEAMQLLNLSPIPELSEIEISTMLDHLSGLSDINGDLTDRNVEDIIKEAEDLLDRSTSSNINESRNTNKSPEPEEKKLDEQSNEQDVISLKESEEHNVQESNSDETTHFNTTSNDIGSVLNTSNDGDNKHFNTPVESTPTTIYSPGGTTNHIKLTIESLKEFSSLVEKKLSSQLNSSPKGGKKSKTEKGFENKHVPVTDSPPNERLINTKEVFNKKNVKPPDLITKKTESSDKSIKFLNCFERLYQVKPLRLSTTKKPKVIDKAPKTVAKKRLNKDLKLMKKNNHQGKVVMERSEVDNDGKNICRQPSLLSFVDENDLLQPDEPSLKYFQSSNNNFSQTRMVDNKSMEEGLTYCPFESNSKRNECRQIPSKIDEKLILKFLEEVEGIKDQVRKAGVANDNPGKKTKREIIADSVEVESSDSAKNTGIKRLEQQFSLLKVKYDHQMEKLEAENFRLREALNSQERLLAPHINVIPQTEELEDLKSEKNVSRSVSSENCKAPRNSPWSSLEVIQKPAITVREAFSQTEEEPKSGRREVGTDAEAVEAFAEGRKMENKENVATKKKPGKFKPFSDVNVQQSMRQKKIIDHESQLLATLRGLQGEVTARDKENRKLKNEMESLRKQMKKCTTGKVEFSRKCHTGTQTIGFGPVLQKPYNPEDYEAPQEFEKENEDLRSRIKALEEDFELLKEKRIADLHALHQVHEEEMAKLVSKLETQSALTRHLHSLLVNR